MHNSIKADSPEQLFESYRTLVDTMSEGLVVHNEAGAIIHFNRAALEILGLSEDQLLGKVAGDPHWKTIREDGSLMTPESHPASITLKTGKPCSNVIMGIAHPTRETRWISIKSVMLPVPEKKVLVTFSDVTPLFRAKEENEFIMDSLGIGVWKVSLPEFSLKWNKYMYELYGMNPGEKVPGYEEWEKCLSEQSREQIKRIWADIFAGKTREFDQILEITTKAGEKKFIVGKGKVTFGAEGSPQVVYGINWDRTKEIELEINLEKEKIKTFQNEKLASLGRLAAEVGHEINNPLAIISGKIEIMNYLLKSYKLPDSDFPEQLSKIKDAVGRIAGIVKSMKLFGRSDDQKVTTFNFVDLLTETVETMKQLYSSDHLVLNLQMDAEKAKLRGSRMRIQQAVVNLLQNARDAVESVKDKKIELTLSVKDDFLMLTVADNGVGIDYSIKNRIFEPFFTTKEINKGTGLGLALVKEIIDSHRGAISFSSSREAGTKFFITLPLETSVESMVHSEEKAHPPLKSKSRILLVDDEEEILNILEFKCKQLCENVEKVTSGEEALKKLKAKNFDIVLSDIKMPGMTGIQFLKALRNDAEILQPRFLFLTAGADIKEADQAYISLHSDGLLLKTLSTEELHEKIRELALPSPETGK